MTESTVEHVLAVLRDQLQFRITTYRSQRTTSIPVTQDEASPRETIDDDEADSPLRAEQADIINWFNTLLDFYDDLLGVNSTPYREYWQRNLRYDFSVSQLLADFRLDLRHPIRIWYSFNGGYNPDIGVIGISRTPLSKPNAALALASELLHAYQDVFDSPTFGHPLFREGADASIRTLAFAHLADTDGCAEWHTIASDYQLYLQLAGYATIKCRHSGLTTADLTELGLTDDEIDRFQSDGIGRVIGSILPSIRWGIDLVDYDYNVGGALILAGKDHFGTDFIADLFHREDHPWSSIAADVTELILQRPSYRLEQAPKAILPR